MRLGHLSLRHFRNISHLEIEPHQVLNFFVGENAQGKTSLIEAIHFLSSLKSFRTGRVQDLIQIGSVGSTIEGTVSTRRSGEKLSLKLRLGSAEAGGLFNRKAFINEKPTPSTKFAGQLRSVVFSPESLAAVKGGPEFRRDLIDLACIQVSQPAWQIQRDFSRALKQRNALLRQLRDGEISESKGLPLLEGIDQSYIELGGDLIFERLDFLEKIYAFFRETLNQILGGESRIEILFQSGTVPWKAAEKEEHRARLREELLNATRRVAEISAGTTLTGPHRHDVSFLFNGNDSRIFCSQGQQRAVILAFKIAEILYHRKVFESYPLLLLDDVLSEFDEHKRHYLIEFLRTNEAQTFLTTTDQAQVLSGSLAFHLESGKIR